MRLMEEFGQRKYEEGKQDGEKRGEKRGKKKGFKKGEKSGFEKGWDKKGLKIAERLVNDNMPIEKVSQITDVPVCQLEQM